MKRLVVALVVVLLGVLAVGLAGIAGAEEYTDRLRQIDEIKRQLDRIEMDRFRERNERQNERQRDSKENRMPTINEGLAQQVRLKKQQQAVVNWLADLDKIQQRDGEIDPLLATSLGMRHGVDPKVLNLYLDVLREERLRKQQ